LLCSRPLHSSPLLSFSHNFKARAAGDHVILSSANPHAKTAHPRFPACHLSLSLSYAPYGDIPPFSGSMIANQRTQGSFSFFFLTANAPQRLSLCLERVFTPASLLNVADSSTPLLFFLLRLRQLTDLRFSLFFPHINARSPAQQAIRRQERIASITGVHLFITPKPPSPDKLALYAWSEGLREKHQEVMLPLRKAGPQVPAGSRGFRNMSVARPPRRGRRRVRKA
jgi:hypothetical protein